MGSNTENGVFGRQPFKKKETRRQMKGVSQLYWTILSRELFFVLLGNKSPKTRLSLEFCQSQNRTVDSTLNETIRSDAVNNREVRFVFSIPTLMIGSSNLIQPTHYLAKTPQAESDYNAARAAIFTPRTYYSRMEYLSFQITRSTIYVLYVYKF